MYNECLLCELADVLLLFFQKETNVNHLFETDSFKLPLVITYRYQSSKDVKLTRKVQGNKHCSM